MWSQVAGRSTGLRRLAPRTLAGQVLALQLAVLLIVVACTSLVSVRQADDDFRDSRSSRLRDAAENLAGTAAVRRALAGRIPVTGIAFNLQVTQSQFLADSTYVASPDGTIVVAVDPIAQGERIDLSQSDVTRIRAWTGDVDDRGRRALAAQVPILTRGGDLVGIAMVAEDYPSVRTRLAGAAPDLLVFLGTGLAVGIAGAWLLARVVKRRTRGLEPADIAALADQREALLTSIREGVVAVNVDGVVTVLSESARELLDLPADSAGRRLADLPLPARLVDLLSGSRRVEDAVHVIGGRVLVLNGNRAEHDGRLVGTVTTLRDRTELMAMQSELNARSSITDTLRAQTHEFSNQLHTISGLVQLEEYAEVAQFVETLTRRRAEISDLVSSRVSDPAVAALLIAKSSLVAERRVELRLSDDSELPRLDPDLSTDVVTVVGNLVDNAADAVGSRGRVDVRLTVDAATVVVQVADTGPGVPSSQVAAIFERGWSTKPSDASGRGLGLALVQVVCERRGGSVSVHNDAGAVFTARLPGGTQA
ncbi:unannotated protein [freshwater metagenome]|uniref:Unannotated protein n=1 Tax=freshwater metagenome TaxID=449393 RepID=A0A6J6RFU4_9ZZZZ